MHSLQLTAVLAMILSLTRLGMTSPTTDAPGLPEVTFIEVSSEVDTNSTFGWRIVENGSDILEKRYPEPDECYKYPRGIGGSVGQYKSDLGALRAAMDSSAGSLT